MGFAYEEGLRSWSGRRVEKHNFMLIGIEPDALLNICDTFRTAPREDLSQILLDQAGFPWVHPFEIAWEKDQDEARSRGLFDLLWHRRALNRDPVVSAQDFAGFDVLLDAARRIDVEAATLLGHVDGNNPANPRRAEGPRWWSEWHRATASKTGGWLEAEEVRTLHGRWHLVSEPEVEEACLEELGATYTGPGCWALLDEFGGFFAQCACEDRSVLVEVDL